MGDDKRRLHEKQSAPIFEVLLTQYFVYPANSIIFNRYFDIVVTCFTINSECPRTSDLVEIPKASLTDKIYRLVESELTIQNISLIEFPSG